MSSLSPGTTAIDQIFSSIGNMASKRVASKDIIEIITGDVVEQVSMNLLVYADTQFFIEKDMKITWQEIKDIFTGSFKDVLEER